MFQGEAVMCKQKQKLCVEIINWEVAGGSVSCHSPSLMVMLRSSSFLKRTVWTLEIAFTTVDFP